MSDSFSAPKRALLLENIHPDAAALLQEAGLTVENIDRAYDEDELVRALPT